MRHEKKCLQNSFSRNKTKADVMFTCPECKKEFSSISNLIQHQNEEGHVTAGGSEQSAENCSAMSSKRDKGEQSNIENQSNASSNKNICLRCRTCKTTFSSHSELYNHRALKHHQTEEIKQTFQNTLWSDSDLPPWMKEDGVLDQDLEITYNQHRHLILKEKKSELTNEIRFNFPVSNNRTVENMVQQIEEIHSDIDNAFKINVSFGVILVNMDTRRYRYFAPYSNENVFPTPLMISDRNGINEFGKQNERVRYNNLHHATET